MAGGLFRKACAGSGARILPVDSEHNALFQAMIGHGDLDLESLVLTASGGPFRGKTAEELRQVTPEQALDHPNWSMGAKVSVDSATLMNKGLEVIEAYHLFGVPAERIEVVVHPQSIVHSLARYRDGSLIAQLGPPDMRIPIAYALAFPRRLDLPLQRLDLVTLGGLTFEKPALDIFPSLGLAYEALERGGSHPAALNAANEAAVSEFIAGRIAFADIARLIETALERVEDLGDTELEALLEVDRRVKDSVIGMACGRS
jgi:1-deoxy-D-xylulose-5-phosphate reductoisomerase